MKAVTKFFVLCMIAAPFVACQKEVNNPSVPQGITSNVSDNTVASSSDGMHIPASQVPTAVKKDYHARYPNATKTQWELQYEDGGVKVYEASFVKANGQKTKAQWLANGTFLGEK